MKWKKPLQELTIEQEIELRKSLKDKRRKYFINEEKQQQKLKRYS